MFDFFRVVYSEDVLKLIHSILQDDGWKQLNDYEFGNGKVKIWTASGVNWIDFSPNIKAFSMAEKKAIHKAIRKRTIINGTKSVNG